MFNAIRSRKGQNRWMREEEKRFRNKTKGRWKVTWKAGIDFIHREIEEVNLDWISPSSAAPLSDDKRSVLPIGPPAVAQKKSSSSKTPKSGLLCGGSRLAWPLQGYSSVILHGNFPPCRHCVIFIPSGSFIAAFISLPLHFTAQEDLLCCNSSRFSLYCIKCVCTSGLKQHWNFFFWGTDANHAGQRPHRYPGPVQMAVGYKASQWASQVPAAPS